MLCNPLWSNFVVHFLRQLKRHLTRKVTYSCPWPYKHVSSVLQLSLQMMSYNKIYYTPFRNNLKVSESNPDMKATLV